METKLAIAFTVLTFYLSSSVFYSPALGFPTIQERKGHLIVSSSNDVDCSRTEDGVKIPSPNSCSEFYECYNGAAYLFKCANMTNGGRLSFDPKLQRCNWPSEVDCEITSTEPPAPTTVDDWSDDTKPKEYIQLVRMLEAVDNSSIDCTQVENGEKIPSPTSCSEYYVCVMGESYLYKCPMMATGDRLYYDPELGVCNWPWMVDCDITTTESPTTTTMITEPSSTTTIKPLSTKAVEINSTTSKPKTGTTTTSISTTMKPITSEKPQTSSLQEDPTTTSKPTSSKP